MQNPCLLANIVLFFNNIIIDYYVYPGYTNISLMDSIKRAN